MSSAGEVRAIIARCGDRENATARLGRIDLRPHQRQAVSRLEDIIERTGGALLADEVGLGKTFVAAAIARNFRSPLVIAPSGLRSMWISALAAAGVEADWTSYERLSRRAAPPGEHDLVILDEAHHARNPATRRYHAIAALTARAAVLLLSATPIHNKRRDLEALMALFLGEQAHAMSDEELARHVLRRERESVDAFARPPIAAAPTWLALPHDEDMLEQLVALPAPLPPADGGDGGALLVHSLVRQWASSDGALLGGLERRACRAAALIAALSEGRHPTRLELRDWSLGDGAVQLAFPELMASPATGDGDALLRAVQRHGDAVDALCHVLRSRPSPDACRAQRIRQIGARHAGEKIIAFSAYADTAIALYRELRADGRVAVLTAKGGRVAGGPVTRRDVIARFAPLAQGVRPPREAERIDLLIATDLLSEGMNLQDASVVVHLDLPWTPARLEQRVGRAARLGSAHQRVAVYALAPPASAEALIAVDARLRQKLAIVCQMVGMRGSRLPPLFDMHGTAARDECPPGEIVRQALASWRAMGTHEEQAELAIAAVEGPHDGFLASMRTVRGPILLAGLQGNVSTELRLVAEVVRLAEGRDCTVDRQRLELANADIARWLASDRAASAAGVGGPAPLRRRLLARIADIVRRAAAHRRPVMAMLAAEARLALARPMGAGVEGELAALLGAGLPDEDWLRAVAAIAGGCTHGAETIPGAPEVVGLLLLQRLA